MLDPSLGEKLNEREYGGDCRLYIEGEGWNFDTLKATLFDEFVVAHTLGWWAKALIMRNWCARYESHYPALLACLQPICTSDTSSLKLTEPYVTGDMFRPAPKDASLGAESQLQ